LDILFLVASSIMQIVYHNRYKIAINKGLIN